MTDDDRDVDITRIAERAVGDVRRSALDYGALVLVAAGAMLLLAGILYAFALVSARDVEGPERFRLLAQASSPFVAALVLAAIVMVIIDRRRDDPQGSETLGSLALVGGATVALVALLLALNGIVIDLTAEVGVVFKLSNVVGRLATVVLAGFALVLAATAPSPAPLGPPRLMVNDQPPQAPPGQGSKS